MSELAVVRKSEWVLVRFVLKPVLFLAILVFGWVVGAWWLYLTGPYHFAKMAIKKDIPKLVTVSVILAWLVAVLYTFKPALEYTSVYLRYLEGFFWDVIEYALNDPDVLKLALFIIGLWVVGLLASKTLPALYRRLV